MNTPVGLGEVEHGFDETAPLNIEEKRISSAAASAQLSDSIEDPPLEERTSYEPPKARYEEYPQEAYIGDGWPLQDAEPASEIVVSRRQYYD